MADKIKNENELENAVGGCRPKPQKNMHVSGRVDISNDVDVYNGYFTCADPNCNHEFEGAVLFPKDSVPGAVGKTCPKCGSIGISRG